MTFRNLPYRGGTFFTTVKEQYSTFNIYTKAQKHALWTAIQACDLCKHIRISLKWDYKAYLMCTQTTSQITALRVKKGKNAIKKHKGEKYI